MTTAGKRSRRIAILKRGTGSDDYGGETGSWTQHTEAFAEVLFGTGQERRAAGQTNATMAATFIAPWTPKLAEVSEKDRITGLSATWEITSIAEIGLARELHFTAVRSDAP